MKTFAGERPISRFLKIVGVLALPSVSVENIRCLSVCKVLLNSKEEKMELFDVALERRPERG